MPTSRTSQSTSQTGTQSGTRTGSRAGSTARTEIFSNLKEDHKRVKKAFRDFEKLDPHEDEARCASLVKQTCAELEVHTTLEEELFYPAARNCLGDEALIDEAEVEHATAKNLIDQLNGMSPEDEKYSATFKVLGEYVKHHIQEEEGEIFPQLSHAKFDWQELLQEMSQRRTELAEEFLPQAAEAQTPEKRSRKASSASASRNKEEQDEGEE